MTIRFHESMTELLVDYEAVQPHPMNPNNGDEEAVERSIRANGVYRPIIAQRAKRGAGTILAGHTQYNVEVRMQLDAGVERPVVPVLFVDVDDKTALRIVAADNKTAADARMDDALLLNLLSELDGELFGSGYDDDELDKLMAKLDGPGDDKLGEGSGDSELDGGELSIIVTCSSEEQQRDLLERFEAEGLLCRPLMM